MEEMTKFERCRFGFPDIVSENGKTKIKNKCLKTNTDVCDADCNKCADFNSRYIEFPIEVSKINIENDNFNLHADRTGEFVKIRPCGEEYKGKTYLGILLGDMPVHPTASYNKTSKELSISMFCNPAIFVPELKKVIFGCESWWGKITSKDDIEALSISDEDINNVWYVKMLKSHFSEGDI